MKKKTYIQLHPIFILLINGPFSFMLLGGIYLFVRDPLFEWVQETGIKRIIILFVYLSTIVYISWILITCNHHWITFRADYIYVPSDWRTKRNRWQYRVEVKYEDIVDISFIRSTKNSKDRTIQEESWSPLYHQYLVLYLKNGREERIFVDYYTKKQKLKILEELKRRLKYCENDIDLTNAQESLKNLGKFGRKVFMDMSEKHDKKHKKKRNMKSKKD